MMPCIFKTKKHLSKEMNGYCTFHMFPSIQWVSFLRTYCMPGPEWGVGFLFYLFPIMNPNDCEFPFSLVQVCKTMLWITEMIFLKQGFPILVQRHQMSAIIFVEGCEVNNKKVLQINLLLREKYTWETESWEWRKGGEQRQTTILQNPENQERVSQNHKDGTWYFNQCWWSRIQNNGWCMPVLWVYQLVAKPVLLAGIWQHSFWHLLAKIFLDTVLC